LQEDRGEELAGVIVEFMAWTAPWMHPPALEEALKRIKQLHLISEKAGSK
jgi:hypothetical protein